MGLNSFLQLKTTIVFVLLSVAVFAQDKTELVIQMGHTDRVTAVAVSPNELYVASGGADKLVKLWLQSTGQELRTFEHVEAITALAFTPDSKWIVASDQGKGLKVWNAETGALVYDLSGHEAPINAMAVSADGLMAVSSASNEFKVWDLKTGYDIRTFSLPKLTKIPGSSSDYATYCEGLAFSPDGKYIYSAGIQQIVNVWETATGRMLRTFSMHDRAVLGLAVSPNGKYLATGTHRGLKLYDTETGNELGYMNKSGSKVRAISFSTDGTVLLAGGDDLILYNVADGTQKFDYKRTNYANSLSITRSGNAIISIEGNALIKRALATGEIQQTYQGTVRSIRASCISTDGKLIVSGGADHAVSIWDAATGKRLKVFDMPTANEQAYILAVAISPDNTRILASSSTHALYTWDVESGKLLSKNEENRSDKPSQKWDIASIAIAPDGKTALLGTWIEIVLWDMIQHKRLFNFRGHDLGMINDVKFSPDGKTFISACGDKRSKLWNVSTQKNIQTMGGTNEWNDQFESAAFMPDGKFAFGGSLNSEIRMWELQGGYTHKTFKGHSSSVSSLSVSPDGKLLASASYDKTIKIWDIASGFILRTLTGHSGNVLSVSFTPDGKSLISSGQDGTIRRWNVETGKEVLALTAFAGGNFLNFTPDGFYTGSKGAFNQGVFYRKGMKIYSFDQFDLQYNRPDIVLERIGAASPEMVIAYKKAVDKRIRKMGFNPLSFEKERSFNVPEITLPANTVFKVETANPVHVISFSAADKLFILDRFFVEVNGVPLYGVKGKSLLAVKAKTTKQTINIPLNLGKNNIKISVMNEKGVESLSETFEINYKPALAAKPNLHIVTVGVSKFVEKDYNLTYADKDAADFAAMFKTQTETYGKIFEYSFTNEKATKLNLLALRATLMKTAVDDQVIVFIASHGVMDKELDYYIAMHNMTFANPKTGGLRYDELENLLDGIPARNKLVLIDACHSGEVDKDESELVAAEIIKSENGVSGRGFKKVIDKTNTGNGIGLANSFELMKELFADLRRTNGAIVISAAAGKEFAFESAEWNNGVFTYSLLEGLKSGNADNNKDKTVSVTELSNYVSERVKTLTNGKQNPTSRTENLDNDFRVW